MKRISLLLVAFTASVASAAKDPTFVDPNEFGDYKVAMASCPGLPMAVEWQNSNNVELVAINDKWCKGVFAKGPCAIESYLEKIEGAYKSDAMVLTKIAALTQYAMTAKAPWWSFGIGRSEERLMWTKALIKKACSSRDDYVKIFIVDQLRWCAYPDQVDEIKEIAANSSDKGLKENISIAVREIAK